MHNIMCIEHSSANFNVYMIPLNYFAESQSSLHGGRKRKRQRLPAFAVGILKQWYEKHEICPYFLSDTEVENLARKGNITEGQVIKWMSNKRWRSKNTLNAKDVKKLRKEEIEKNPKAAHGHKKPHPSLPTRAVEMLNEYYENNVTHPYPTDDEKENLAKEAKITVKQVTTWFGNKRNRSDNTKKKKQKADSQSESRVDDVTGTANDNVSNRDHGNDNVCDNDNENDNVSNRDHGNDNVSDNDNETDDVSDSDNENDNENDNVI